MNTLELAKRIRRHAVDMTHFGNSSHVGSVLSMADIIAVLYGKVLNVDALNAKWDGRDRFILSKGHAGAGIYAALAELGFFPVSELHKHYQNGSIFSGHVSHKGVPGVEFSTGSLGHGASVACGMALRAKMDSLEYHVDVVLSDGELGEGSNWEAFLFAAHHKLSNLTITIDYNNLQSLRKVSETLALEDICAKFESFNLHCMRVNGHDHEGLLRAYQEARSNRSQCSVVVADTVKGRGVSFMENSVLWHYRSPHGEEYNAAKLELE